MRGRLDITVAENQDFTYKTSSKFVATDMDANNNNNAGAGIDVNDLTLGTLACTNCVYTLHDVKIWQSINQTHESLSSHPFQMNVDCPEYLVTRYLIFPLLQI